MKFYGTPNMLVKEKKRKPMSTDFVFKPLFRFNADGEFETNNEKLISKLKRRFEYEKLKQCKKCDFKTENMGELLLHYRKEHPKGDDKN